MSRDTLRQVIDPLFAPFDWPWGSIVALTILALILYAAARGTLPIPVDADRF